MGKLKRIRSTVVIYIESRNSYSEQGLIKKIVEALHYLEKHASLAI